MKYGKITAVLAAAAGTLLLSAAALQDKGTSEAGYDEMMGEFPPAMMPSEAHERLEPLAGKWHMKVRMQMEPGADWTESSATAERKWIYDGRYMIEEVEGDFLGMGFEGMSIMGYDNVRKEYFATWIDNFGTGIMISRGQADASGKVITYEGTASDAMSGKKDVWMKSVSRVVSDDEVVFEMYAKDDAGQVYKNMEIINTRM